MSLPFLLQGFGSVGIFASRAFLPAFVTALLIRLGPHVPGLAQWGLLPRLGGMPTWFTSDATLIVLGLLAALELLAERSPEAKSVLDEIHHYLKAGMAALTYLGVLSAADRAAVAPLLRTAGVLDLVPVVGVAVGTLLVARVRSSVFGPLTAADEDDDLGLQRLLRWAGDLWGLIGPAALLVFPLLTLAAFGIAGLGLILLERQVAARGERLKVPCARCGTLIHASALVCPSCQNPGAKPRAVGLLGRPRTGPANRDTLPFDLVAVKRCPACATRLSQRAVRQICPACGCRSLDDPVFAAGYVAAIDRRVPLACLVCFLLGLIPVLGVIPGVIYYRLTVVAPFRRYIPPIQGVGLRWGVRLAILALVVCQWVPVAGGLALPAMGLINYAAYRTAYRRLALAP